MKPADVVLVLHFVLAAFIVSALLLIWAGGLLRWRWTLNPWFRYSHFAAIVFITAESVLGVPCPLTTLESALRGNDAQTSFIGYWAARLLYLNLPGWVFTVSYVLFALAVLITLLAVPPGRRGNRSAGA